MDYVYFITISLCGLLMIASPSSLMGKAKYTEEGIKSQGLIRKLGIGIAIFGLFMIIIKYFFL